MCMQSASPEAHGRLGLHKLPQSISLLLANISLTAYFFYLPKPFLSSPFFFFFFSFFFHLFVSAAQNAAVPKLLIRHSCRPQILLLDGILLMVGRREKSPACAGIYL